MISLYKPKASTNMFFQSYKLHFIFIGQILMSIQLYWYISFCDTSQIRNVHFKKAKLSFFNLIVNLISLIKKLQESKCLVFFLIVLFMERLR